MLNWDLTLQAINVMALAAMAYMLAKGILVPMWVVEKFMLAPLHNRIEALEKVSARRDEQHAELQRMMAAAIEAQSRALELLHEERGTP